MANSIKIEVFSLTALEIANGVTLTSAYSIVDNTVMVNIQNMTSVFYNTDYFFNPITKKITWLAELQSNLVVGDNVSITYEEESTDGHAWNVTNQYTKTLTYDDIIRKFIIIPESIASDNCEFNIRHAPEQIIEYSGITGYDFDINVDANMVTWNGMALDGQLTEGDEVTVIYPVIDPIGRRIREQHTVSGDIFTNKEITLLTERIPDTSITVEVRGAPSQTLSADFMADLNTVRWATTSLSGQLEEGDEIAIIYHTQQGMGVNPYKIIIEYANEEQWGLAPDLQDDVRSKLKYTSRDRLPSSLAIRKALFAIDPNIYQINAGSGDVYGIYDYSENVTVTGTGLIPAGLDAIIGGKNIEKTYYRPIEVSGGHIAIGEDDEFVEIGTVAVSDSFTERTAADRFSVQGGRYQYGSIVTESGVTSDGKVLANAKPNDLIAKIFIRLFEGIVDKDATYSIGTRTNPRRFVKDFQFQVAEFAESAAQTERSYITAPTGLFEGWQYGNELINNEYAWLDGNTFPVNTDTFAGATTADIIENTLDILLFSNRNAVGGQLSGNNGESQLSGRIGVSIFYDEANFDNIQGYLLGSSSDAVERLNMYTDTVSITQLGATMSSINEAYASSWNGENDIYSAGGGNALSATASLINKYNVITDTFEVIPAELPIAVSGAVAGTSQTNMYVFGGAMENGNSAISGQAYKLTYATDTIEGTYSLESKRNNAGCVSLQNKMYLFGGIETYNTGVPTDAFSGVPVSAVPGSGWLEATKLTDSIEVYDSVTDTSEVMEATLNTARMNCKGFPKNRGTIYMVGGESLTGMVPSVERLDIENDTTTELAGPIVPVSRGMIVHDKLNGYYCGGICNFASEIEINIIQKCIMASGTWEIMNERTSTRKSMQDSTSTVPFNVFVSQ